jgi:hypothetical protein
LSKIFDPHWELEIAPPRLAAGSELDAPPERYIFRSVERIAIFIPQ